MAVSGRVVQRRCGASTSERQSVLLLGERMAKQRAGAAKVADKPGQVESKTSSKQSNALSELVAQLAAANERNLRLSELQSMIDLKDSQVLQCKDHIAALERNVAQVTNLSFRKSEKNAAEKMALLR